MSTTPSSAVAPRSSAREVDEFLKVVLADRDLLVAEFEAIIEEAWGGNCSESKPSTRRSASSWVSAPVGDRQVSPLASVEPHSPRERVRSPPVSRH